MLSFSSTPYSPLKRPSTFMMQKDRRTVGGSSHSSRFRCYHSPRFDSHRHFSSLLSQMWPSSRQAQTTCTLILVASSPHSCPLPSSFHGSPGPTHHASLVPYCLFRNSRCGSFPVTYPATNTFYFAAPGGQVFGIVPARNPSAGELLTRRSRTLFGYANSGNLRGSRIELGKKETCWTLVVQALVRALVIEHVAKIIEADLLCAKGCRRRFRRVLLQCAMHPLMATVLLRSAYFDALMHDP